MPVYSYTFGGMHIQSGFHLSGLHPLSGTAINTSPDIRIFLAQGSPPQSDLVFSWPGRYGLKLAMTGDQYLFLTASYGSFLVSSRADTIQCFPETKAESRNVSDGLCQVLMRRVLPRVTQLFGRTCLHGATVMLNERETLLVLGPTHAGKSTMAAELHRKFGWKILSDDISIIDSSVTPPLSFATVAGACLWPDSLASCTAPAVKYHKLPAHDEKRWCTFEEEAPSSMATVRALLFIDGKEVGCGKTELRQLPLATAMVSAMQQVVRFNPADMAMIKHYMDSLALLLQQIPAFKLSYHRSYDTLPIVADYVRSHFKDKLSPVVKSMPGDEQ